MNALAERQTPVKCVGIISWVVCCATYVFETPLVMWCSRWWWRARAVRRAFLGLIPFCFMKFEGGVGVLSNLRSGRTPWETQRLSWIRVVRDMCPVWSLIYSAGSLGPSDAMRSTWYLLCSFILIYYGLLCSTDLSQRYDPSALFLSSASADVALDETRRLFPGAWMWILLFMWMLMLVFALVTPSCVSNIVFSMD